MDEDSYRDEQLVELYDSDNAARDDHEYYRILADTVEANKILDFGCGHRAPDSSPGNAMACGHRCRSQRNDVGLRAPSARVRGRHLDRR